MKKLLVLAAGLLLISLNVLADDVSIDSDGNVTTGVSGAGNLEVTGSSGEDAIVGRSEDSGAAAVYGEHMVNGQVDNFGILGDDNYGVYGNSLNGDAGFFQGNAHVTGNLTVDGSLIGPSIGDITAVTVNPGTGLTGGGTSGTVTLDADTNYLQRRVTGTCATGSSISVVNANGTVSCETDDVGITTETDPTVNALGKASLTCTSGQVAKWNGTAWACANDTDTNTQYSAGTGLNLSGGTTFNVNVPLALSGSVSFGGIISGTNSHSSGRGVAGSSPAIGGYFDGTGSTGRGVHGMASMSGAATNYGGYFMSFGDTGYGVYSITYGTGVNYGVYGETTSATGYGLYGKATGSGANYGVYGESTSTTGIGIYAVNSAGGIAARFRGNVQIQNTSGTTIMELGDGLDYAEGFDVSDEFKIEPGTVLIIDPDNPGKLKVSVKPYDAKVAGIVAGANGLGSGVRLGGNQFNSDVALAGRVYCNVDATESDIEPGDMLTTSDTPGYAMKVTDHRKAQGAILGKAMEKIGKGNKGQILVLVTLQ